MEKEEETIQKALFSIGEVCTMLSVSHAQLRHWEKEFEALKPRKGKGGIRTYDRKDIELLQLIVHLLKVKNLTIEGAKAKLKLGSNEDARILRTINSLKNIRAFLEEIKDEL